MTLPEEIKKIHDENIKTEKTFVAPAKGAAASKAAPAKAVKGAPAKGAPAPAATTS